MGSNCWGRANTSTKGKPLLEVARAEADHAAHDGDLEVGALLLDEAHTSELGVGAVLGVLAHATGVDHDDVGTGGVGDGFHAEARETGGQLLAVRHVHLAADRPEEVTLRHDAPVPVAEGEGFEPIEPTFPPVSA